MGLPVLATWVMVFFAKEEEVMIEDELSALRLDVFDDVQNILDLDI